MHDDGTPHFHAWSEEAKSELAAVIWETENVELTTVGIDIGSSTSHLMFSRVHLQRKTQMLSSRFVVVGRDILWASPILLTPLLADDSIDAERLRAFVDEAYRAAGLAASDVDSGAVILTGEAIKRTNAEAIARVFAADAGKFVCASAGHHLEGLLAAHGSGAAALSRRTHRTILNVDIGGGTTKLALLRNGEVLSTCAVAVGGRLVAFAADGTLARVEEPARQAARALGFALPPGGRLDAASLDRLVDAFADIVIAMLRQEAPAGLAKELLLTEPLAADPKPHAVAFSGGVSEYIFGRERATFGDIAKPLAERIGRAFAGGRSAAKMIDPGQGIRATVIGASQFTVQVSGNTIHLSDEARLPLRNVPVVCPHLGQEAEWHPGPVAAAVRAALERIDAGPGQPVALAVRWHGDPHHYRLRGLAQGIADALGREGGTPLILMIDGDCGRLLGHVLRDELDVRRAVISIDGIELRDFDYVDIGELMRPTNVVPVVIKSLLFPGQGARE